MKSSKVLATGVIGLTLSLVIAACGKTGKTDPTDPKKQPLESTRQPSGDKTKVGGDDAKASAAKAASVPLATFAKGEMKFEDDLNCVTQYFYFTPAQDETKVAYYKLRAYGFVDKYMGNNTELNSYLYPSRESNGGFDSRVPWKKHTDGRYRTSYSAGCGGSWTDAQRAKAHADFETRFAGLQMEVITVFIGDSSSAQNPSSTAVVPSYVSESPTAAQCAAACAFVDCVPNSEQARVCSPSKKSFLVYHIEGRCGWKLPSDGVCQ